VGCYVAVCTLQAWSARRREALRCPPRAERGGAYCGGRPPTACCCCCYYYYYYYYATVVYRNTGTHLRHGIRVGQGHVSIRSATLHNPRASTARWLPNLLDPYLRPHRLTSDDQIQRGNQSTEEAWVDNVPRNLRRQSTSAPIIFRNPIYTSRPYDSATVDCAL